MKRVCAWVLSCFIVINSLNMSKVVQASVEISDTLHASENVILDIMNEESNNELEYVQGEVILTIKSEYSGINKLFSVEDFPGVDIAEIEDLTPIGKKSKELMRRGEFKQILRIELLEQGVMDALDVLYNNHMVEDATPNYIINNVDSNSVQYTQGESEKSSFLELNTSLLSTNSNYLIPNDPYVSKQSEAYLVQCPFAWALETGSDTVKVGIIDTGIASHEDLNDNIALGFDYVNNGEIYYMDTDGHGTAVAGIIGAVGNNAKGISGVAWDVSLVPLRIGVQWEQLDFDGLLRAIQDANNRGIDILNMSLSFDIILTQIEVAINQFDGLVVCSAGNKGINIDTSTSKIYPATYECENLICVANMTNAGKLATDTNYGNKSVDLAAPGMNVYTTDRNGGYTTGYSGTSFAAPFVTGASALLLSRNPYLSVPQMKSAILDSVVPLEKYGTLSDYTDELKTGGCLDVNAALSLVMSNRVKNYKLATKFCNNQDTIYAYYLVANYDEGLVELIDYSNGTVSVIEESFYDDRVDDETRCVEYFVTTSCAENEGTLVELRFNCPFEGEAGLNSIIVQEEDLQMLGPSVYPDTEIIKVLMGDVNLDGVIDSSDALLVNQSVVKLVTLTNEQKVAADVNEDGAVTAEDALKIQNYQVKLISSFW